MVPNAIFVCLRILHARSHNYAMVNNIRRHLISKIHIQLHKLDSQFKRKT